MDTEGVMCVQMSADLNGVALLAPVMRALLEQTTADEDDKHLQLTIGSCSEALLQWVASEHGKDQGGASPNIGDEVMDWETFLETAHIGRNCCDRYQDGLKQVAT